MRKDLQHLPLLFQNAPWLSLRQPGCPCDRPSARLAARATRLRLLAPALRRALRATAPSPPAPPTPTTGGTLPESFRSAPNEAQPLATWLNACPSPTDVRLVRTIWMVV